MAAKLNEDQKSTIIDIIDTILRASNLTTVSIKKVRTGLQAQLDYDIIAQKKEVDALITARFDNILAQTSNGATASSEPEEVEQDDEEEASPPIEVEAPAASSPSRKRRRKSETLSADAKLAAELHAQLNGGGRPSRAVAAGGKKKTVPKKRKSKATVESDGEAAEQPEKKKRGNNAAFMAPMILSQPLADLLGETQLSRPETVKRIWAYVKDRGLQDPTDKRYIQCDERMKPIFGNKVHMFTMNKILAQNLFKPEE
ncbi:hypothetical protein RUND412_004604 [Rhizina undulata]